VTTGTFPPPIDRSDPGTGWQSCTEVTAWEGSWLEKPCDSCSGTWVLRRVRPGDLHRTTDGPAVTPSAVTDGFYEMILYSRDYQLPEAWPHVSSIQARDSGVTPERPQTASVCFNGIQSPSDTSMHEVTAYYYSSAWDDMRTYAHGGRHLNGSACQDTGIAPSRGHATLYRFGCRSATAADDPRVLPGPPASERVPGRRSAVDRLAE